MNTVFKIGHYTGESLS